MGLDNPVHILLIVVLLLLVFGAKRLPEIGRSLGTGMREFKHSVTGEAGHSHNTQPPGQQASLPPAAAQQAPPSPPTPQQAAPAPVPSSAQASAQDAFAQRDSASNEQR